MGSLGNYHLNTPICTSPIAILPLNGASPPQFNQGSKAGLKNIKIQISNFKPNPLPLPPKIRTTNNKN
jgi:hypothetical protein